MSLKLGKKQVQQMIETLEGDYESVEEAAEAVLAAAEAIFRDRAKYVVVGQLCASQERVQIPPDDPEAIKVSLGWYSTEGEALGAATSLWHSSSSGDSFNTWVLPVFHGTPTELHARQKEKYEAAELARKEKARERVHESIRKHQAAMEERAKGGSGSCENCSHQPYDHRPAGTGRGKCAVAGCVCERWKERTKHND